MAVFMAEVWMKFDPEIIPKDQRWVGCAQDQLQQGIQCDI